jgi:phosphoglycolate phosphatase
MIVEAMNRAFVTHNRAILPRVETLSIVGLSLPYAIEVLLDKKDEETDSIAQSFKDAYHQIRQERNEEPLYPHAREIIAKLNSQGLVMGVATGKNMRGLKHVLNMHGLDYAFSTLQTADNAQSKPHPEMIWQAKHESGIEKVIMIGDTSYDMEMARAGGAYAIGVLWGYHTREQLINAGAEVIVEDYHQLYDAVMAKIGHPKI